MISAKIPASANVVKLCGNFLVAAAIETLAETLTLAEKNGVDKKAVADMIGKTSSPVPLSGYAKQIADERFEPAGFRLALGLKDINLISQRRHRDPRRCRSAACCMTAGFRQSPKAAAISIGPPSR